MSTEALQLEAILAALPEAIGAQLASARLIEETGSTQDDALAEPIPESGAALFLAERQTAGQGRRGRRWIAPPGAAITLSLARRFNRSPSQMAGLSLAVGVAIAEALHAQGFPQVRLKWPNDLQVDGRKLGGILVTLRADRERCAAVIGIGLNLRLPAEAAEAIDQPWIDLAALVDPPPPRNALIAALLAQLLPILDGFDAQGLAPLQSRWQALDALVGQTVQVIEGEAHHVGLCLGIAPDGALRLRDLDGVVREHRSGDASLRRA